MKKKIISISAALLALLTLAACSSEKEPEAKAKDLVKQVQNSSENDENTQEALLEKFETEGLPFSTGVDKNGNYLKQDAGISKYKQFMHFKYDNTDSRFVYSYVIDTEDSIANPFSDIASDLEDFSENVKEMPYSYTIGDRLEQQTYMCLYDSKLIEKFKEENPTALDDLPYSFEEYLSLPYGDQLENLLPSQELISSGSGEASDFTYHFAVLDTSKGTTSQGVTLTVTFELTDSVTFLYKMTNISPDLNAEAEIQDIASRIVID